MPWLAMLPTADSALAQSPTSASALLGQWQGKMQSQPSLAMTAEKEDGKLMGAVLFYVIRPNLSGAPAASPGFPEPMIQPRSDGQTLSFKVSHRQAHPMRTLNDPRPGLRLELTCPDRAHLDASGGRHFGLTSQIMWLSNQVTHLAPRGWLRGEAS